MRFTLYMLPEGLVSGMCLADQPPASDGRTMHELMGGDDGSTPWHEFDVPPAPHPDGIDVPWPALSPEQATQVAHLVYEVASEAACEALNRNMVCPVHADEEHGGEAEELRLGIEDIIGDDSIDDVDELYRRLRRLLDEVDCRDSLAHAERKAGLLKAPTGGDGESDAD